jgi:hypothetical protein
LVRKVEQLFGGMGSLNDMILPAHCEHLRNELYVAVQGVLRDHWRALGRESHMAGPEKFAVGAIVRLIPGAVRYIERDESEVVVPNTPDVADRTWKIVRLDGPDITNMPRYLIQHDNTFMSARQESLALISKP